MSDQFLDKLPVSGHSYLGLQQLFHNLASSTYFVGVQNCQLGFAKALAATVQSSFGTGSGSIMVGQCAV